MSQQASKAVIGLFVLGAITLAIIGVIMLGSGKLFSPTKRYVMYFDGSVKGLSVGAPVVFRGVKIGSVIDITLLGDLRDMSFKVPVIVEVDRNRFQLAQEDSANQNYDQALINQGIRAQLQQQSLVTGQLVIDIDFRPEREARLVPDSSGYPQIPTIPSTAYEIAQKLEELPLQQLVNRVNDLVGGLERLVNSPDMQEIPHTLNLAVDEARILLTSIDHQVAQLSDDTRTTIKAATAAIGRFDKALTFQEGVPAELAANINRLLSDAGNSLHQFDETLAAIKATASDERSKYELRHSLKDLGETIRSLNALIEYLNQHPETLLRGKTNLEEQ